MGFFCCCDVFSLFFDCLFICLGGVRGCFVGRFLVISSLSGARLRCMQSSALINSAIGTPVRVLSGSAATRGSISLVAFTDPGCERGSGRAGLQAPGRIRPEGMLRVRAQPSLPPGKRGVSPLTMPGGSAGSTPPARPGPRLNAGGGGAGLGSPRGSAEPGCGECTLRPHRRPSRNREMPPTSSSCGGGTRPRADFLGA